MQNSNGEGMKETQPIYVKRTDRRATDADRALRLPSFLSVLIRLAWLVHVWSGRTGTAPRDAATAERVVRAKIWNVFVYFWRGEKKYFETFWEYYFSQENKVIILLFYPIEKIDFMLYFESPTFSSIPSKL